MSTDPLVGCWAKIERADETIKQLDSEIRLFLDAHSHTRIRDVNEQSSEQVVEATGKNPPPRVSVLIGEVVHHLRSSLDHLVLQLVLREGNTPDDRTGFPVCDDAEKFEDRPTQRKIKGVARSAAAIIECAQPYHRGPEYIDHPLWLIHRLDITDKHKLLIVSAHRSELSYLNRPPEFFKSIDILGSQDVSSNTAAQLARIELHSSNADMNVKATTTSNVVFPELGSARHEPVIPCLEQFSQVVRGVIQSFSEQF